MIIKILSLLFLFFLSFKNLNAINIKINNENNNEPIKVFLIPHSHCDVGWVQTYDQYYRLNVSIILDNIYNTLIKDSSKKFNWAEIIYFERWYNEQSNETKEQVKFLVNEKRLYFLGGGWAQNDEAVTDYQAVINQMTLGHQFLWNEFGFKPEIGWQIDPFGPSTITPTLFTLMGFKYHVINRIDERIKYVYNASQMNIPDSGKMTTDKEFEFVWYPSPNNQNISIFTHVLDHHYESPFLTVQNYENPYSSYTTGFDFEGDPSINPSINSKNLLSRALVLVEIIQQRSELFRHSNLLLPFGNDFRFQNSSLEFENMDILIKYINSNEKFNINIKYSTLDEYFDAVYPNENPSIQFPKLSNQDYFVYTQCQYNTFQTTGTCVNYWSGYYSSYAEMKQIPRQSDSLLRSAEMLYSLFSTSSISSQYEQVLEDTLIAIQQHRNVSGILTHHDAVTGTSKTFVRENYLEMLDQVQYDTMSNVIPIVVGYLLSNQSINLDYSCNNTLIDALEGDIYAISFTNSLAWDRYEFVEIQLPESFKVAIYDGELNPVPSEIIQRPDKNNTYYLYIQVKVSALGISTYFINILENENLINNQLLELIENGIVEKPIISNFIKLNEIIQNNQNISIGNSIFNLNFQFNENNIFSLNSFDDLSRNEFSIPITQNYIEYISFDESAYTQRSQNASNPLELTNPKYYVSNGTMVKVVTIIYTYNCSQSYIVYQSPNNSATDGFINEEQYFEIDNIVAAGWNKEVGGKFTTTSINNNNLFYTSNGLELMEREYKELYGDNQTMSMMAGNYFPTINTVQILDSSNQLTILTRQSMGVSSQSNGEIEYLFIRRSQYIGPTLNQPLNDVSNPLIKLRILFGLPSIIESIRTPHSLLFENPLQPIYSTINDIQMDKWKKMYNTDFKPFAESLPYNLHLLTFTKQNLTSNQTNQYFTRFLNIYEIGQSQIFSQPIQISINNYFNKFNITNIKESSLSFNSILGDLNLNDYITLNPLNIKSYLININK